jgi:hypothetical protein
VDSGFNRYASTLESQLEKGETNMFKSICCNVSDVETVLNKFEADNEDKYPTLQVITGIGDVNVLIVFEVDND